MERTSEAIEFASASLRYALYFTDIFGTSLSLLLTILAIVGVVVGSAVAIAFRWRTPKGSDSTAPLYIQARIDEVYDALRAQKAIALTAGIANSLLVFGQIVIGGTLASSFLQEKVDKNIMGALGVLVLISSLVHQQFRPDLVRRGARRRIVRLGAILREAEDSVFSLEHGDKSEDIGAVRKRVSDGLTSIESSEVEELPGERAVAGLSEKRGSAPGGGGSGSAATLESTADKR